MSEKRKLKTVIVDDNKEFRAALRLVFELFDEIEVISEYDNGQAFLKSLNTQIPNLVFMDIEMPEMNGIEATKRAIHKFPNLKIVALSFHNQFEYIQQMLFAGATNYVIKDELDHHKIQTIINSIIKLKLTIKN